MHVHVCVRVRVPCCITLLLNKRCVCVLPTKQSTQQRNATQRRVVALRLSLSLSSASVSPFLHKQRSKQHEPLSFSTATWPPLWKEREAAAVGEPAQAEAQRRQKSMNERWESVLVCVFCCCCLLRVCFHNRYVCVCVWRREHFLHKLSVLAFNLN